MDEYISREAIIEELEEEIEAGDEFDEKDVLINKGLKIALKDIKRQPAADAQPIKHGLWIEHNDWIECNVCKFEVNDGYYEKRDMTSTETRYTYCPRCGARMDGAE